MYPVEDFSRSRATLTVDGLSWVWIVQVGGRQLLYNPGDRKFRSVIEKMLEWEPCPNRGRAPRPPVEQPRRRERKAVIARRVGSSICCKVCSVSNSLSHTTLSIKWEVYFSKKNCVRSSLLYRRYDSACICIWVCYNMKKIWKM